MPENSTTAAQSILQALPGCCVLAFDEKGDLVAANDEAVTLLQKVNPDDVVLSLQNLHEFFNLEHMPAATEVQTDEVSRKKHVLQVVRKKVDEDGFCGTLVTIANNTGQRKKLNTAYRQTSDLLWKIRSRITPVQSALTIMNEFKTGLDEHSFTELATSSRFEIQQIERYLDIFRDLSLLGSSDLKKSLAIESVSLDRLIDTAIENVGHLFAHHNPAPCMVKSAVVSANCRADANRLIHIIESLLINAAVYSNRPAEVEVSLECRDDWVVLAVRDNGWGIPDADQPHIFRYGYRGKNGERTEYSGPGCELYLARQLLLYFDATIDFTSKENHGTAFEISFHQRKA
ncbi:MAG: hypothetical protein GF398_02430 [Chitinivibrionales bacterium]|nr:hypothetical protein [Chitinivibrionales bacterium]